MIERDHETGLYVDSRRVLHPRGLHPRIERPRFGAMQQAMMAQNIAAGGGGGGTVAFDNVASNLTTSATNVLTWSHTVGASLTNGILIVGVSLNDSSSKTVSAASVTWNGTAMTAQVPSGQVFPNNSSTSGNIYMFYLLNPAAGAFTVSVTASGNTSNGMECGSMSFSRVNQSTPFTGTATAFGNSATCSKALTVAAQNMGISMVGAGNSLSAPTQTQKWIRNSSLATGAGNACGDITTAGAGSITFQDTVAGGGDFWGIIVTALAHD